MSQKSVKKESPPVQKEGSTNGFALDIMIMTMDGFILISGSLIRERSSLPLNGYLTDLDIKMLLPSTQPSLDTPS